MKQLKRLSAHLNSRKVRRGWHGFIIIFFLIFVILPTIFVLSYVFTGWDVISGDILSGKNSVEFQWDVDSATEIQRYEVYAFPAPQADPFHEDATLNITSATERGSVLTGIEGDIYISVVAYTNNTYTVSNTAGSGDFLGPACSLHLEDGVLTWNISGQADGVAVYSYENGMSPLDSGTLVAWANGTDSMEIPASLLNGTFRILVVDDGHVTYSNAVSVEEEGPIISISYFQEAHTLSMVFTSLKISFEIAAIVTVIDIIAGLPMAWILVRKDFRGKEYLDTLIDMPLAVPTAALGFSTALFWGITPGLISSPPGALSIVSSPVILIILLHVVFSYPYMVRSLGAILEEIDINYEIAGETLGASKLTAVRTITLPLFRAGLITGVILSFARSLSETGGTMIALATLGSMTKTSPVLIGTWKHASKYNPSLVSALAFTSIVLILLALVLLVIIKIVVMRVKIPFRRVWPTAEKWFSRGFAPKLKDTGALLFLVVVILIPSFFIFGFVATSEPTVGPSWGPFWQSLYYSFLVAGVVTVIDLLLGIPLALYITRSGNEKITHILDVLVNVPLIVPTAALGFSLGMFWTTQKIIPISGLLLVIFAHVAFTYPLVARNVIGAMEETSEEYENTARTLGAKPTQVFRKVTFPMIKASVLAGAIMAFTRSLGETGATLAVVPEAITAPVYIVTLIKTYHAYYQAGLACIILIGVSYAAMLAIRYVTRRK